MTDTWQGTPIPEYSPWPEDAPSPRFTPVDHDPFDTLYGQSAMAPMPPKQSSYAAKLLDPFNPPRVRGVVETIKDAFTLDRDENGVPKPRSVGNMLATALMGIGGGRQMAAIPNRAAPAVTSSSNPIPPKFRDISIETPSGRTDTTGLWFLDGDKPVYAQATQRGAEQLLGKRADDLAKYGSMSGKNAEGSPITVWYKPGQEGQAKKVIDVFGRPRSNDISSQIKYHMDNGEALGYSKQSIENYIRSRFGSGYVLTPVDHDPFAQ